MPPQQDRDRLKNEAEATPTRSCRKRAARPRGIQQDAEALSRRRWRRPKARRAVPAVYEQYKAARRRASACIWRRWNACSAAADKTSSTRCAGRGRAPPAARQLTAKRCACASSGRGKMKSLPARDRLASSLAVLSGSMFPVRQTGSGARAALRRASGQAQPDHRARPATSRFPLLIRTVVKHRQSHPRLESPKQEVLASDNQRIDVDAFVRYRIVDPLKFYQAANTISRQQPSEPRSSTRRFAPRARRGHQQTDRAR